MGTNETVKARVVLTSPRGAVAGLLRDLLVWLALLGPSFVERKFHVG